MQAYKNQAHVYKESGLRNVIIQVAMHKCPKCGEALPVIPNVKGLHALIADRLFQKPTPLTGPEVRFLRKEMRMQAKGFATMLGVTPVTVSRWETGVERVGPAADRLIRCLYLFQRIEAGREVQPAQSFQRIRADFGQIQRVKRPRHLRINIPAAALA